MWTNLPDEGRTRARSVDNIRGDDPIPRTRTERNGTEECPNVPPRADALARVRGEGRRGDAARPKFNVALYCLVPSWRSTHHKCIVFIVFV